MVFLIFPHQLFENINNIDKNDDIFLIEEPIFFTQFKFHKLKLAYHRATMKFYYDYLIDNKFKVKYINFYNVDKHFYKQFLKYKNINIYFLGDNKLEKKLNILKNKLNILNTHNFLINHNEINDIKKIIYKNNRYSHSEFYKYQRRKLNILIKNDEPIGDRWSFDTENRNKLPNNIEIPNIIKKKENDYILEAKNYVIKHFSNNYGSLDNFIYPINFKETKKWLNTFLKERLNKFGVYQDAVDENEPFLFHSVLTPMMNVGLITDEQVVNISYNYYNNNSIKIQSFEGFIRQIIGWRNYVYLLYLLEGNKMRKSNFFKHKNKLPYKKLWEGTTNIKPIDTIINRIVEYSYAHHIERLMYLGNFLLLCRINPNDIYKIFMEWTIDAYDWVMVPNVYGMSQYASPIMMTRPYFSSSSYIFRMSSFRKTKKEEWHIIWDSIYYSFINDNQTFLKSNYATANMVRHWERMKDKKKVIDKANEYLNNFIK
jgi:deoxyribodipyrimidine photolyase-related protein